LSIPLSQACDFNPKDGSKHGSSPFVWKWKEQGRVELRAQLDAAYFHVHGISREDAAYILSTFQTSGDASDSLSTTALILSHNDALAAA